MSICRARSVATAEEILTTQRQKFVGKVQNTRLLNKNWRDCGLGGQIQLQHIKNNVEQVMIERTPNPFLNPNGNPKPSPIP